MKKKYYDHWFLLVYSLYTLLKPKISDEEFDSVSDALKTFHDQVQEYYGEQFMSFNVHTLKHVMKFIKYFGPLWAWSAFGFEHYNSVIKKLFHGTQCIPDQIAKSYYRLKEIKNKSEIFDRENCSESGKKLFIKMMNHCNVKNCIKYNDDLKFFSVKKYELLNLEKHLLSIHFENDNDLEDLEICERFMHKKIIWHTLSYERLQKRINSCVLTKNNKIYLVDKIMKLRFENSISENVVVFGIQIDILENECLCQVGSKSTSSFSFIGKKSSNVRIIDVTNFKSKCVYIELEDNKVYVVPVVNNVETD